MAVLLGHVFGAGVMKALKLEGRQITKFQLNFEVDSLVEIKTTELLDDGNELVELLKRYHLVEQPAEQQEELIIGLDLAQADEVA